MAQKQRKQEKGGKPGKVPHKQTASHAGREPFWKQRTFLWVVGIVVILLLAYTFFSKQQKETVLAEVNGEQITASELALQYLRIPKEVRATVDTRQLLQQTINEELILQEAKRLGITVTREEVDKLLQQSLTQAGVDAKAMEESLQQEGITKEDLISIYQRQLTLSKVIQQEVQTLVSPEVARKFYQENKEKFGNRTFVEVQNALIQILSSQQEQVALSNYIKKLRERVEIRVYEENLK
ncbi:SurA N-terminal domain-containing protein [Candidatus Woesearchaeota archaeon]|nr:SurA N-terminal domain-containing protein [Candidatus Woesearchaeota archaeon]